MVVLFIIFSLMTKEQFLATGSIIKLSYDYIVPVLLLALYLCVFYEVKKKGMKPSRAFILSSIIPGTGQYLCGKKRRGIIFFIITISSLLLNLLGIKYIITHYTSLKFLKFIFLLWITPFIMWVINVYDAQRVASTKKH